MELQNYFFLITLHAIGLSQQYNQFETDLENINFFDKRPIKEDNIDFGKNVESNLNEARNRRNRNQVYNRIIHNTQSSEDAIRQVNVRNAVNNKQNGDVNSIQTNDLSMVVADFGLRTLKNLETTHSENIVISPLSIAMTLGVLQQGAVGETLDQLTSILRMTSDETRLFYKGVVENIKKRRNERNVLNVATNMFISSAFDINPNFKRNATHDFGSEVTPLNFASAENASQTINNWVAYNTKNKIEKLVSPDAIDTNTQLVLANVVFFKGLWQTMFNPEATLPHKFYITEDENKVVPFMRIKSNYKIGYDQENHAEVVILPFEKEEYSLIVILPVETSTCASVLSSISRTHLWNYLKFPVKEINLEIPKFTIRADTDLKTLLIKMGVTNIFSLKSELFKLGTYRNFSPQVTSALHTAVLSVDERGGTAAAATAFAAVALSYDDSSFKINRPFLAVLWDGQLSLPLFMAKIQDPSI